MFRCWLRRAVNRASRRLPAVRCRPRLETLEGRHLPTSIFWAVDADGLWNVASNWIDDQGNHRLPSFNDDVYLDRPAGSFTITHAQSNDDTFNSIHATTAALVVSGGTVHARSTSNLDGPVTISGGMLASDSPTTANGAIQWTAGTIANDGPLTISGTLTLSGSDYKYLSGTIVNHGTIAQTGGDLIDGPSGRLHNEADGLFDLQSDANVVGNNGFTGDFTNMGTVLKSGGAGLSSVPALINQGGTIDVESGTLRLGGADKNQTSGGTFIVAAGADLDLTTGAHDGSYAGTYTGQGNGTVSVSKGTFLGTGSNGAILNFPDGMFRWSGGAINANTSFIVNTGSITLDGPDPKTLQRDLTNDGIIHLTDTGNFVLPSGVTLMNQADGVVSLESDASVLDSGGSYGTLQNIGYFVKSGGTGTSVFAANFSNNGGTLEVDTGTLAFGHDVLQTGGLALLAGGNLVVPNLNIQVGTLSGSGLIIGNVTNGGTLEVGGSGAAGTLTITGNYTQTASGILNIELGDPTQAEFDQLNIGGQATLGGTLNVILLGDYFAESGDSFRILTFGSLSGDFQVYNLPDISPFSLVPLKDNTSLTLVTQ
jgi:hypothetical protein